MRNKFTYTGFFIFLFLLFTGFQSNAATDPDIVVALDGSGDYTSIQEAIDAVPSNSERPTLILIKRGLYDTEKLIVPADKKNLTIIGESRAETIISYHIYDCSGGKCPAEDAALWTGDNIRTSATLTILGDGFRAENLSIQNTAGPVGQAQAVTIRADKVVFVNCDLKGYQDTIYLWSNGNRSYFEGCLVVGRTDYIYGGGTAWFEECEIRSWGGGWITAPSTVEAEEFGYVFNNCTLTYATGSPRNGDDGATVALGRPWHNYPKVTWMNTEMTEMIDPLGWPTTWNMDYAATDSRLKLYEYNNTGPGADMSGRADWVGIRALTDEEAQDYTIQNVLGGQDAWDPSAAAPAVQNYRWTGSGNTADWLLAANWDPAAVPASGELATVEGDVDIHAGGGSFAADLILRNGARLHITDNSTLTYMALAGAAIITSAERSLEGKLATKEASTFDITSTGVLNLKARLAGVHTLRKEGSGKLILTADNMDFSGDWLLTTGTLEANAANALGKGSVHVSSGATLIVGDDHALQPTAQLKVEEGAALVLNGNVTLSEFYINGEMQELGEYTAESHPGLISGNGKVLVGRPDKFTFLGGNWDDPANFSPALMPQAGETVLVETEMETTSTVFPANIILTAKGNIRMRGDHSATGDIEMQAGSRINYATSGTGFALDAPIHVSGDVSMVMSSGNSAGSALTLSGPVRGEATITAHNNRGEVSEATLLLEGDNSDFSGIWDLTKPNGTEGSVTQVKGNSPNAFGTADIVVAAGNKVVFSHAQAAGDRLSLRLEDGGKAVLEVDIAVESFFLNGEEMPAGTYNAARQADLFEGDASIVVAGGGAELSADATLAALSVDGETIAGFEAGTNTYTVELAAGTTSVEVAATTTHEQAEIIRGTGTVQLSAESATSHEIEVRAEDGSISIYTITFILSGPTGLANLSSVGVRMYPNPTSDRLMLSNAESLAFIRIYNLQGRLQKTIETKGASNVSIHVADLSKGIYILEAIQKDHTLLKEKLLVN